MANNRWQQRIWRAACGLLAGAAANWVCANDHGAKFGDNRDGWIGGSLDRGGIKSSESGTSSPVAGPPADARPPLPRLKVSDNHRFLVTADGQPFFWLGDTAWELFHRLDRVEAELYLRDRAAKGFNVIQAVALAELDGLTVPNRQGSVRLPLSQ